MDFEKILRVARKNELSKKEVFLFVLYFNTLTGKVFIMDLCYEYLLPRIALYIKTII